METIDYSKVQQVSEDLYVSADVTTRRCIRSYDVGNDLPYGGKGAVEIHITFERGTPVEVVRLIPKESDGIRIRRFRVGSNREVT